MELLPEFFQAINPYMPFTFCINAMRECIGGMYGNNYVTYLLSVSAIYIPISLLIGIVLRRPVIWLMNFFEHQVEKDRPAVNGAQIWTKSRHGFLFPLKVHEH